jgi:hypothetical protein
MRIQINRIHLGLILVHHLLMIIFAIIAEYEHIEIKIVSDIAIHFLSMCMLIDFFI